MHDVAFERFIERFCNTSSTCVQVVVAAQSPADDGRATYATPLAAVGEVCPSLLPARFAMTPLMSVLHPERTNFWSGSSAPAGRQTAGRRQRISALVRPAALRGVLSRPQPLTASAPEGTSAARQARRGGPRVRAPGNRPSPPADNVTMRRPGPALSMTRRWRRTGSACRPAIRCRNAGSPRCSDAHPAAGREPESPMHDRHRRLPDSPSTPVTAYPVSRDGPASFRNAIVTASGRSGIRVSGQTDPRCV